MKLDPTSLKLFVSVLETGAITKAAEREHIAPAAVSRRIADLEYALNASLLVRSNKGVQPTPAGLTLLYLARKLLNDLDDIHAQIQEFAHGQRGTVHVLANTSVITQFMPALLGSFAQAHPSIHVRLEERNSLQIARSLSDGLADMGLFTRLPHGTDIETYPFREDDLIVLAPRHHPLADRGSVSFAETLAYEHVALASGTQLNYQLTKAAGELNAAVKLRTEVSGYDAMCLLVNAGLGIAILPRNSAQVFQIPDTRAIALDEAWAHRTILLGVKSRAALLPAARLLFDHLLADAPLQAPAGARTC